MEELVVSRELITRFQFHAPSCIIMHELPNLEPLVFVFSRNLHTMTNIKIFQNLFSKSNVPSAQDELKGQKQSTSLIDQGSTPLSEKAPEVLVERDTEEVGTGKAYPSKTAHVYRLVEREFLSPNFRINNAHEDVSFDDFEDKAAADIILVGRVCERFSRLHRLTTNEKLRAELLCKMKWFNLAKACPQAREDAKVANAIWHEVNDARNARNAVLDEEKFSNKEAEKTVCDSELLAFGENGESKKMAHHPADTSSVYSEHDGDDSSEKSDISSRYKAVSRNGSECRVEASEPGETGKSALFKEPEVDIKPAELKQDVSFQDDSPFSTLTRSSGKENVPYTFVMKNCSVIMNWPEPREVSPLKENPFRKKHPNVDWDDPLWFTRRKRAKPVKLTACDDGTDADADGSSTPVVLERELKEVEPLLDSNTENQSLQEVGGKAKGAKKEWLDEIVSQKDNPSGLKVRHIIGTAITSTRKVTRVVKGKVLYDFVPEESNELMVTRGEDVWFIAHSGGWLAALNKKGQVGLVPASFVEISNYCKGSEISTRFDLVPVEVWDPIRWQPVIDRCLEAFSELGTDCPNDLLSRELKLESGFVDVKRSSCSSMVALFSNDNDQRETTRTETEQHCMGLDLGHEENHTTVTNTISEKGEGETQNGERRERQDRERKDRETQNGERRERQDRERKDRERQSKEQDKGKQGKEIHEKEITQRIPHCRKRDFWRCKWISPGLVKLKQKASRTHCNTLQNPTKIPTDKSPDLKVNPEKECHSTHSTQPDKTGRSFKTLMKILKVLKIGGKRSSAKDTSRGPEVPFERAPKAKHSLEAEAQPGTKEMDNGMEKTVKNETGKHQKTTVWMLLINRFRRFVRAKRELPGKWF